MRKLAFLAPLAAVLAVAAAAPAMADPATVHVTVDEGFGFKIKELGERDVERQAERLAEVVQTRLARDGALEGARVDLVLTFLRPNRPTFQQMVDRPGLDAHRSISIGGAAIEGQITMADGSVVPVSYDWFSHSIAQVQGFTTWQDAERAYHRLASNLIDGRYVVR